MLRLFALLMGAFILSPACGDDDGFVGDGGAGGSVDGGAGGSIDGGGPDAAASDGAMPAPACPTAGLLEGNAAITGEASVDGFFGAVINFRRAAESVSDTIDGQLAGIAADLQIDGSLLAGLAAFSEANFDSGLEARVQQPMCEVDVRLAFGSSVDCQRDAGCDVDVDPAASYRCGGACDDCGDAVDTSCAAESGAQVECRGACDADHEPPPALTVCASATCCNATAKAELHRNVVCTPPPVELVYVFSAALSADVEATDRVVRQLAQLRGRLGALASLLARSRFLLWAGDDLSAAAKDARKGTLCLDGSAKAEVVDRTMACAAAEFDTAAGLVGAASEDLGASATTVTKIFVVLGTSG